MKNIKIITHDGKFHADEVCAIAILKIIYPKSKIIRTREEELFKTADLLVDIGRKYNPKKGLFDHHQIEFKEKRENNVPYASFGLIWKNFGKKLIPEKEEFLEFDKNIVQFIDSQDSGSELIKNDPRIFSISKIVQIFNPTEKENESENFTKVLEIIKKILERIIKQYNLLSKNKKIIKKEIKKSEEEFLILPNHRIPWGKILLKYPQFKFVIYKTPSEWRSYATFKEENSFKRRTYFPKEWAGLEKEQLENISGIRGARFCHKKRFICTSNSKESIIKLTLKALNKK